MDKPSPVMGDKMMNRYFEFLDALREGGSVNMFHGPTYLREVYGLNRTESHKVFNAWKEKFNEQ